MFKPTDELTSVVNSFDIKILFDKVSIERINDELCKILIKGDIDYLIQSNFIGKIIPEYKAFEDKQYKSIVLKHITEVVRLARKYDDISLILAGLFHDIGKAFTGEWSTDKNRYIYYGHEDISSIVTLKRLKELRFSKKIIKDVVFIVQNHMKIKFFNSKNPKSFIKFLLTHGLDNVEKLILFNSLDWGGKPLKDQISLDVNNKQEQLVSMFDKYSKIIKYCNNNYKKELRQIGKLINKNSNIDVWQKSTMILGEKVQFIINRVDEVEKPTNIIF